MAYLASTSEVKVRLTAKAPTGQEAQALLAPLVAEVRGRLGDALFTADNEELEEAVGRLLRVAGKSLACAESLNGGGVATRLTSVSGASDYLIGSAVTYTAGAKREVLGVSQETIDGPGVVSEACALEMAAGARRVFGAHIGLSLTGAAGPKPHRGRRTGNRVDRDRRGRRASRARVPRAGRALPGTPVGRAGGPRPAAAVPGGRPTARQ